MLKSLTLQTQSVRNTVDYLLIYLLISLSGNQAFGDVALVAAFVVSLVIFLYRKTKMDRIFLFFIFLLTSILLLQTIKFDFYPWVTLAGLYVRVLLAYFIVKSVGQTFTKKYVDIMVVISLISLVFVLLENIIPNIINYIKPYAFYAKEVVLENGILKANYYTGIHTFVITPYSPFDFIRNSGPFWESGAFGGYLMIALLFNIIKTGQLFNRNGIILFITIITTFSTTSYVAFAALIFFYLITSRKYKILKMSLLPFIGVLGFFLFTSLDFISAKIESRVELAQRPGIIYTDSSSRFVDAVRDLHAFKGHEIIGRGQNKETRLSKIDKQSGYTMRTNGFTDHLVEFGFVFFIFTFFLLYKSFLAVNNYYHNLNNLFALYVIFIIILVLQSEVYFGYPFFWSLLFLYSVYKKNEKENDALYHNARI